MASFFKVGERLTVADISVACTMLNLYKLVLDPAFRYKMKTIIFVLQINLCLFLLPFNQISLLT